MADRNQQLNVPFKEPTFIKSGFSNWKNALSKFRTRERSTYHVATEKVSSCCTEYRFSILGRS